MADRKRQERTNPAVAAVVNHTARATSRRTRIWKRVVGSSGEQRASGAVGTKWKEAKESILDSQSYPARGYSGWALFDEEAKTLTDNIALLARSCRRSRRGSARRNSFRTWRQRGLGAFRAHLQACPAISGLELRVQRADVEQFFSAAQEIKALEMDELWELRPFASWWLFGSRGRTRRRDRKLSIRWS